MLDHLVDLGIAEDQNLLPARLCLEVVLPLQPVVVEQLPWVGWHAEAEDDDKELSEEGPTAAGPAGLLQHMMPFSIILTYSLIDFKILLFPPAGDQGGDTHP